MTRYKSRLENKSREQTFKIFDRLNKKLSTNEKHDMAHCLRAEFCGLEDDFNSENPHCYSTYWLKKAAEEGNLCAQANLGYNYEVGEGVEKDYTKAMEWYAKAYHQDSLTMAYYLGLKYLEGKITDKNNTRAIELIHKAAVEGFYETRIMYGLCKLYGVGISKNEIEGLEWINGSYSKKDTVDNEYRVYYLSQEKAALEIIKSREEIMDKNLTKSKYQFWVGYEAVVSDILKAQLQELMEKLDYGQNKVLMITAKGNSSYQAQSFCWVKMEAVRICMEQNFPTVKYCVEYGGKGHPSFIEFELKDPEFAGPQRIPPPHGWLNHHFNFCGKANFSP